MRITRKKVLYILSSIGLIFLILFISDKYSSTNISEFISRVGVFAPLLYILIQIAGQIFAPLSTSALFVAGFILFGKSAVVYSIITWLISSIINFYLAKRYGKKILRIFIGEEGILKIENIAKRIDTKKFFMLRLSTFYINDFASYAFGLTNITFTKYYLATILSMIPWSIVMVLVMKNGESIILTTIKIFISMIPFALLSYFFLKRNRK